MFTDAVAQTGHLYRCSENSYVHLGEDWNLRQVFQKEKWRSHFNLVTLVDRTVQLVELISFLAPAMVLLFWLGSAIAGLAGR